MTALDILPLDWGMVVSVVGGALGGGGLTGLFLTKTQKQKETIDVQDKVAGLSEKYLHIIREQNEELAREKREASEREDALVEENQRLRDKLETLRSEATTKGIYLCTHLGCICRMPVVGRGKTYYDQHKDEPDFGADYTPIEALLARHKRRPPRERTLYCRAETDRGEDTDNQIDNQDDNQDETDTHTDIQGRGLHDR